MEPELDLTDINVCQQKMGIWIALALQDDGTNPLGWCSMVVLMSLWEHTGMERLQVNDI